MFTKEMVQEEIRAMLKGGLCEEKGDCKFADSFGGAMPLLAIFGLKALTVGATVGGKGSAAIDLIFAGAHLGYRLRKREEEQELDETMRTTQKVVDSLDSVIQEIDDILKQSEAATGAAPANTEADPYSTPVEVYPGKTTAALSVSDKVQDIMPG